MITQIRAAKGSVLAASLWIFACLWNNAAHAAKPTTQERTFVGTLLKATFRPTHDMLSEIKQVQNHPPTSISIDLRCATARLTYIPMTAEGDSSKSLEVDADLGEWCDLPEGLDGLPVLADIARVGNTWVLKHAYSFQLSFKGLPVLVPDGDPVVCGVRLWDLRSPLGRNYKPYVYDRTLSPSQLRMMTKQGIVARDPHGQLIYISGIRLQKLIQAMEASPCKLRPSDFRRKKRKGDGGN